MKREGTFLVLGCCLLACTLIGCRKSQPVTTPVAPTDETVSDDSGGVATDPAEDTTTAPDAASATVAPAGQTAMSVTIPVGLPPLPIPADNPMTEEKVELGKMLYFDTRLSKDGKISCATCHDPTMGWAEHTPTSTGIGGQVGGRNSPSVINAAYAPAQFWDGRAASLEEQSLGPMANPIEMGHQVPDIVDELNQIEAYRQRFQAVFGTDVTSDGMAKAIAAFERTVISGNSPYDRYEAGDESALTDDQKEGMQLFDSAGCSTCHAPPLFSNYRYYNAGVGADAETPDEGRKDVTERDSDLGKFRVPALRDVADTAPYFHDGSAETLEQAVELMATGGTDNPNLSSVLKSVRDVELSQEDQQKIVEFLKALSGEYPIVDPPELP